jgi:hypothetical protein
VTSGKVKWFAIRLSYKGSAKDLIYIVFHVALRLLDSRGHWLLVRHSLSQSGLFVRGGFALSPFGDSFDFWSPACILFQMKIGTIDRQDFAEILVTIARCHVIRVHPTKSTYREIFTPCKNYSIIVHG